MMAGSKASKNGAVPEAAQNVQGLSFEDSLRELEAVAGQLESGGVGLEESLRLLGRGMELLARCENELSSAEAVLEQLVLNDEGELEAVRVDAGG